MSDDPTATDNRAPALRLIVTPDPAPFAANTDPTGTDDRAPALRLIVSPASSTSP
jgi:hypothetical protein